MKPRKENFISKNIFFVVALTVLIGIFYSLINKQDPIIGIGFGFGVGYAITGIYALIKREIFFVSLRGAGGMYWIYGTQAMITGVVNMIVGGVIVYIFYK